MAKVILYGSYARGDFNENSDIDFLIVLKGESIKKFREIMEMSRVVHPLILKHNIEISFQPYSLSKFTTEKSPLLFWIRKEGVEV